jgi:hypothetical protein
MDNAPIHTSPGLNPIEQFWTLVKAQAICHKLSDVETLEGGIVEAANNILIKHLQNIVLHLKNCFENCSNKIPS